MLVYVIRHGQTICNVQRVWNGQRNDLELTEQGCKDAQRAGKILEGLKFDRVFSSDLSRAIKTAQIALPGANIEKDERIRELDIGSLEGTSSVSFSEAQGPDYQKNLLENNYKPYGGEDQAMITSRITSFMKMLESLEDCERIAVVTHQGLICQIMRYVLGFDILRAKMKAENGSVSILEYQDGQWALKAFNL